MNNYIRIVINMQEFIDIIDSQNKFVPKSIIEIGSLHGKDVDELEQRYKTNNVTIFEAHPVFYNNIKNNFPNYDVLNYAISNVDKEIMFNCVDSEGIRKGISSCMDRKNADYTKTKIMAKRMDTYITEENLTEIDVLKIDVEGHSYEVLEGFGNKLKIVKAIHIENEHILVWENQKLYADVEKLLVMNRFILASIKSAWPQSDSVWIRQDLFNHNWWR